MPLLAVSVGVLLRMAWDFNAMNAGEETAATMGVPVKWLKCISLGLVTLIASITIAFSGVIGFIGLIAPHAARSMAGTDNRYLLPASGMMGAIVLLFRIPFPGRSFLQRRFRSESSLRCWACRFLSISRVAAA